jgi:hypothetical protein
VVFDENACAGIEGDHHVGAALVALAHQIGEGVILIGPVFAMTIASPAPDPNWPSKITSSTEVATSNIAVDRDRDRLRVLVAPKFSVPEAAA